MKVAVITPEDMSDVDVSRLSELEQIIGAGMRSFVDVGNALAEVRDSELYRESYRTFEAYVADRWGWTRSTAYDYICAAEVQDNVRPVVQLPTLRHARMLSAFSASQQRTMAPEIVGLTVKDATKVVKQWRDAETNTDPVSKAARAEIREALRSEDPIGFFDTWYKATAVMIARMGELPTDELTSVAQGIKSLAETYNTIREARRG